MSFFTIATFLTATLLGTKPVEGATVADSCGSWDASSVVCINKYASVLPGQFSRAIPANLAGTDSFAATEVPSDTSFASIANATFIVYDSSVAEDILGSSPNLEVMFTTPMINHEAPIYVPDSGHLYVSPIAQADTELLLIDVNASPPTLEYFSAEPPLYAATGSAYSDGLIYYSTTGINDTTTDDFVTTGIYTFNPKTNETETLLNNYYGYYLNGADDIAIESNGDIWFTDDYYSWLDQTATVQPTLTPAIYRFRPSTGVVQVANTALSQPNGIRFSPDGKTLYVTDTGAANGPVDVSFDEIQYTWDSKGARTIYAFDVVQYSSNTSSIINGRPIYLANEWAPDGLQVAKNGYLVTAAGWSVDILDQYGILLVQIQVPFRVGSIAFAGEDMNELWLVGMGNIARVQWALQGQ
ncbi:hypothetical protein BDV25DRAFT_15089 [Aspergillus avenaceus]|uniref:SMP-30/Gluconolactonase/LRE-like region domain-containing protein n=1 Tax=Aspergillus avenaceus TaxID=36643 RepID=A0A5N6U5G6_ASPAV|nr:hypothetical protein BDV25DRAFT_15089 [Aspergillus avenaceus]